MIFIGLGRMGEGMSARLVKQGFTVHGTDQDETAAAAAAANGVIVHNTIAEALAAVPAPRVVWLMVPARVVDDVIGGLLAPLEAGDTIIDGGNSFYKESIARHQQLARHDINFIDCGTSGGVAGARTGASLMVGGNTSAVAAVENIFEALAVPRGYAHVGGPGAGHFVKMVHNGIEYGMMGALAEGVNIIEQHKDEFTLDLNGVMQAYQHGSIISSNLTTWLAKAYQTPGYLDAIVGQVPEGETEVEMEYLVKNNQATILDAALKQRQQTRIEPSVTGTLISAMRNQFGGHKTINKDTS